MLWATNTHSLHTSALHVNMLERAVRREAAEVLSGEADFLAVFSGTRGCRCAEKFGVDERLREACEKGMSGGGDLGWRRFIHLTTMTGRSTSFPKWNTRYSWGHAGDVQTCSGWGRRRQRQRQWRGAETVTPCAHAIMMSGSAGHARNPKARFRRMHDPIREIWKRLRIYITSVAKFQIANRWELTEP